jgi:uncharacterized protein (TIGR03083 family)
METTRHLECLASDYARLREAAAAADPGAKVPTCPEWTVSDLVDHVAKVYLHKVQCMRLGHHPEDWPPDLSAETPLASLDRGYADLAAEFATRPAGSAAYTWYQPDQTVGFWIRRMAQETVIHRVDAELAAGVQIAPIPDDLAVDGVDEVLVAFLEYGVKGWPEEFADTLGGASSASIRLDAGAASFLVRLAPGTLEVAPAEVEAPADATVSGDSASVLLWLWNRTAEDAVTCSGDDAALDVLRRSMVISTQ